MVFAELRRGAMYIVRGRGVLKIDDARDSSPQSVAFLAHGNIPYWASSEDIIRLADWRDVDLYDEQARPRGVACDEPECWCKRRRVS